MPPKPKVLISTPVWGEKYIRTFLDYSLASLFARHNIPALTQDYDVELFIITAPQHKQDIYRSRIYRDHHAQVTFNVVSFHELGVTENPPGAKSVQKYNFLSTMQNASIQRSLLFDAHVFNYAHFIWADGALPNILSDLMANDIFALTGFVMAAERNKALAFLDGLRAGHTIDLPPLAATRFVLGNLEKDSRLRKWDGNYFTHSPSFLIWETRSSGIVCRAFHQTILAVRSNLPNEIYREGIQGWAMDSFFIGNLLRVSPWKNVSSSDRAFFFSLHKPIESSRIPARRKKEAMLKFARENFSQVHFQLASKPIRMTTRTDYDPSEFDALVKKSEEDLEFLFSQIGNFPEDRHNGEGRIVPPPAHFAHVNTMEIAVPVPEPEDSLLPSSVFRTCAGRIQSFVSAFRACYTKT